MSDNQNTGSDFLENTLYPADDEGEPLDNPEEGSELPEDDQLDAVDETESEGEEEDQEADDGTYEIKAAGEIHKLNLDQLKEFAQKGIGFNANSSKLAREHKAEMALLTQERAEVAAEKAKVRDYLDVFGKSEKFKKHLEYLQEFDLPEYRRLTEMLEDMDGLIVSSKKETAEANVQTAIKVLEQHFSSEWADVKTRKSLLESGSKFFEKLGLSSEELNQLSSGPGAGAVYAAAIKAQKYDDLMAKKAEAQKTPPKNITKKVGSVSKVPQTPELDIAGELFPNLK